MNNLYHFLAIIVSISGLVWRDQLFWVQTLLKEISTRESSSNWLGQVYVRFTIWKSFVKRLLQHAAACNSKWSKILSIVWFHGQYVAFVMRDMHLLMRLNTSYCVLYVLIFKSPFLATFVSSKNAYTCLNACISLLIWHRNVHGIDIAECQ